MRAAPILAAVLCAACAAQRGAPTARELFPSPAPVNAEVVPNPTPPPAPVPTFPAPPENATAIASDGGSYMVFVTPTPLTFRTATTEHAQLEVVVE